MSPRLQSTRRRAPSWWATLVVLQACALFVGWRVLGLGVAAAAVDSDPRVALSWRPHDPEALLDASDDALRHRDTATASVLAWRALVASPLDGRAYRNLAFVADAGGDRARAAALLGIAMHRSPRDLPTREKLIEYAARDADYPALLRQIDFVLRIQPQSIDAYGPGLVGLAQDPAAARLLSGLLATRPPWREGFLSMAANLDTNPAAIDRLFAIRGSNDRLSDAGTEDDLLLGRQLRDERWTEAYITWVGTLSKAQRTVQGNVFDGSFRFPPSGAGFDWQLPQDGTGYDVVTGSTGKPANRTLLQVSFDGLPLDYRPVRERLILAPGRYRFTGLGLASDLTGDGLYWDIACETGRQQPLMQAATFKGDMSWQAFATEFAVPASGCSTQWLQLDLVLGRLEPQPMNGSAAFSGLAIVRLGDATPATGARDGRTPTADDEPAMRLQ